MIHKDAVISPYATLSSTCSIDAGTYVGSRVAIGERVVVKAGATLNGLCQIADDCVIGTGCVLDAGDDAGSVVIEAGAILAASVTVSGPAKIGKGARIEAGTTILRDVPPHALVAGNPAQIIGYTSTAERSEDLPAGKRNSHQVECSSVHGVTLHRFPRIIDLRGNLTVGEFERTVPFSPKRYFIVFGVPNAEIRGEHAHRTCKQFLICARGTCSVVADDGEHREEFLLDDPSLGLYLPPLTWGIQYKYSPDAVLLVFASEYYDSNEYIRDYDDFIELVAQARST